MKNKDKNKRTVRKLVNNYEKSKPIVKELVESYKKNSKRRL
jgi:hypothetical protein